MLLRVYFIFKDCGSPQLPFPACSRLRNLRRRARELVCVFARARAYASLSGAFPECDGAARVGGAYARNMGVKHS